MPPGRMLSSGGATARAAGRDYTGERLILERSCMYTVGGEGGQEVRRAEPDECRAWRPARRAFYCHG